MMRAMLLCAGYGTRLGDLTRELPKPMLPLHGRPLVEYLLCHLASQHVREVAINLHFLPEMLPAYLGDGGRWGMKITYSHEPELLGTAGTVKRLADYFRTGTFLVHYGDILTDQDITAMLAFHRAHGALATMLVHQRAQSNSVVSLDAAQRVIGFLERPTAAERQGVTSNWVNSGICLCEPAVLDLIPETVPCDFPRHVFPRLVPGGGLFAYPLQGYRCAIDSPARYEQACAALAIGECHITLPRASGIPCALPSAG